MPAYYNEFSPYPAQWLRNLSAAGHVPHGYIDERSITEVISQDLAGYDQCHFFAGIGGWPLALRLAGHERLPCWTGSPPCQPFSVAGKQRGTDDERHLAPVWLNLIRECRPPILFGEQVADAIKHGWLDDLFDALEECGYACGAAVLPACSVGAPHIRKRLFFGAVRLDDANLQYFQPTRNKEGAENLSGPKSAERMANAHQDGCKPGREIQPVCSKHDAEYGGTTGRLAHTNSPGQCKLRWSEPIQKEYLTAQHIGENNGAGQNYGSWSGADWLGCRDGKFRQVEPGTQPLAHGVSARVGRLRAYGNAIVPQIAAEFVKGFMDAL